MERPLADIDISTSLEPETKNWCRQVLLEMGYDHVVLGTHQEPDKLRPFKRFYLGLRDKIIQHIESGRQPTLAYRKAPTGGVAEYQALLEQANQAREGEFGDGNQQSSHLLSLGLRTSRKRHGENTGK
ncbi:hypothetical protein HRG_013171 [Hirsutella rhossiliensis]